MRAVAAYAILSTDMPGMKLLSLLLLSLALGLAPLYPAPAHGAFMHQQAHADRATMHADMAVESSLPASQGQHDCGQSQSQPASDCDGQCCGVCILTLAGAVQHSAAAALFGVNDSPLYRPRTYTSFVATLLGRPPQS